MMKIIQIPVKEILPDFFFSFTSDRDLKSLKQSIQTSGIRTPVHVRLKTNRYQLISGFSRYAIAKDLHIGQIPGISGILAVKSGKIGLWGKLPGLTRNMDAATISKITRDRRSQVL